MKKLKVITLMVTFLVFLISCTNTSNNSRPTQEIHNYLCAGPKNVQVTDPKQCPDYISPKLEENNQEPIQEQEKQSGNKGVIIKTPDTENTLFELKGNEIIKDIDICGNTFSADVSLDRFNIPDPKNCQVISTTDVTNYCEIGSRKGENINYYYCRPTRHIECNEVSSDGTITNKKYYSIVKVLELIDEKRHTNECTNAAFQLVDIKVKPCTIEIYGWECSE